MVDTHVVNSLCTYCRDVSPQWVVREGGENSLLWCQSCFHVSVAGTEISWPIDPLPFVSSMSVLVKSLDEDHGRLVGLLNELQEAARAGNAEQKTRLGELLLLDLQRHLAREEAFLEDCEYPDLSRHRLQHGCFDRDIRQHVSQLSSAPADQVVFKIKLSLLGHLVEDMKYKAFIKQHIDDDDPGASLIGRPPIPHAD